MNSTALTISQEYTEPYESKKERAFMNSFVKTLRSPKVTMIAELGMNHEGDVDVAVDIIGRLSGSGAAAIKLQSFTPERLSSASNQTRLNTLKKFSLSLDHHFYLREKAHKAGLAFISTPCTEDWVHPLFDICDAIKIASGDIDFEPTISAVAAGNLPVIMSTGSASMTEVDDAVDMFKFFHGDRPLSDSLFLMHCVSEYPTSIKDCNLNSIPFMRDRYGLEIGWSNHVIGPLACYSAVALGASSVEVHVTNDKCNRDFRDHALSFEPHEIKPLVDALNDIQSSRGVFDKKPTVAELENVRLIRKGLIYAHDLKAGDILSEQDIIYARPAVNYFSGEVNNVLGKALCKNVQAGYLVSESDFK
jgi:N,N'-diacetyllegionaminate synthase